MSDKQRWPIAEAQAVADELMTVLKPLCEPDRLMVAGSIRRQRHHVGDVEIVYVPRFEERAVDLLAMEKMDVVAEQLDRMILEGALERRPNIRGHFTWGEKNKLAIHKASGIPVDFFAVPDPACWHVSVVIRTGGKETNLQLTNGALTRGLSLNAYGCGTTHRRSGLVTPATSEEHVFRLCGVPYAEPEHRL